MLTLNFNSKKLLIAIFLVLMSFSLRSLAFYTFQDSGDLLQPGQYALGSELQVLTSRDTGANIVGKLDGALNDEFGFRAVLGTGNTDIQLQGLLKWVPIPDYESQPAIGLVTGFLWASYESRVSKNKNENEFSVRVSPFFSKKFDSEIGPFTPYLALPFAIRNYASETEVPFHLVLGSKFSHKELKNTNFTLELGFDIDKSFDYISIGAIFELERTTN